MKHNNSSEVVYKVVLHQTITLFPTNYRCQATVFRLLDDEEEPSDEGAAPDNISTKVNETTNETERFVSEPCHGLVKPDIVFFGEDLPERFHKMRKQDFQAADCLLVLGTSLQVAPFNYSILLGGKSIPRVLINNEKVGTVEDMRHPEGFRFDDKRNFRDLFLEGNCDDIVAEMCTELGWEKELEALERGAANRNGWELMVKNQAREEDRVAVARRGGD